MVTGRLPTTVVVPTLGRSSLRTLLDALAACGDPRPERVVVVDDRPGGADLDAELGVWDRSTLEVVRTYGRGPAAARNRGWRRARTPWVSFLDDDVVPDADWTRALAADLAGAGDDVVGVQGRVCVPLPAERRPTDWERSTAGLAKARWITADMTYRRSALADVGGFDERFPRAFREDADLALRVLATGGRLVTGERGVTHPVRPVDDWVSLRQQQGNADDPLMRRLHGRGWRARAEAPRGRLPRHLVTTAGALLAPLVLLRRSRIVGLGGLLVFALGTAELAAARIVSGPRDLAEVRRMLLTSVTIPPVASWHAALGRLRHRRATPWQGPPELVLFDRDGTLVHDVPYNGDPGAVVPFDGALAALDRLRAAGVRTGVVTNQSGVGSGLITAAQMAAVNSRVEALLGPFDIWQVCPHRSDQGCSCRKPRPELVRAACAELGVQPRHCVVVGDIGTDVLAAQAAGATGVLVPTKKTRLEEIDAALQVAEDLGAAVTHLLAGAG